LNDEYRLADEYSLDEHKCQWFATRARYWSGSTLWRANWGHCLYHCVCHLEVNAGPSQQHGIAVRAIFTALSSMVSEPSGWRLAEPTATELGVQQTE